MDKKVSLIIAGIFLTLFLTGMVSALDFGLDNYKSFIKDSKYGTIEIWDKGQILLFQPKDKKLVSHKLLENTHSCGIECYARGVSIFYTPGFLFDEMNFYDLVNNNKKNIDYEVYLIEKFMDSERYILYEGQKLTGEIEWLLKGYKKSEESVDWIGTSFGKVMNEWLDWTGSLDLLHNDTLTSSTGFTPGTHTFNSTGMMLIDGTDSEQKHYDVVTMNTTEIWFKVFHIGGGSYVQGVNFADDAGVVGIRLDTNNFQMLGCTDSEVEGITGLHSDNWAYVIVQLHANNSVDAWLDFTSFSNIDTSTKATVTSRSCPDIDYTNDTLRFYWTTSGAIFRDLLIYRYQHLEATTSSPPDLSYTIDITPDFSCNFTGTEGYNITDVSLLVYDSANNLDYTNTESGLQTPSYNKTWADVALPLDTYNWSCLGEGTLNSSVITFNRTLIVSEFAETSQTYNDFTYETESEAFIINYSVSVAKTTTANLFFANSDMGAGTKTGNDTEMTFTKILTHTTNGTNEFYWKVTYGAESFNSTIHNQTVNNTEFNICNTSDIYLNTTFLNITFLDEETLTRVGAQIDTSTFEYWLGDGSVTEQLIYSNLTNMSEYNFCFTPASRTMHNTREIQYSASGYPQRKYDDSTDLTNTTTHKTLYLLSSADGIYSTIQVVDENGDVVTGADVTMERQFAGVWTIVGKETSDGAGAVTFWVNPDYDHRFTLEKTGCVVTTGTVRPTQTTYTATINCLGVEDEIYIAPIEGIKYFLLPASGLLTTGQQNFSFQVASSKNNLVNAKFEIVNGSGYVLTSQTNACASAGCTISKLYNVTSAQNIKGRYYVDLGDGYILLEADAHWI